MPKIMPLSDLRNYNTVLVCVTENTPVFLTKNGRGRYAVVDIAAYERLNAELKLVSAIAEGEGCAMREGWIDAKSARKRFGV